ncbi:phosphate-starvation-inducible PsiE family protein [Allocoleopsis franciscana]|uniref:Putative membrane protein n=1 Tax=Allocoleopsis franciscana PCC 7113 TaxID=1173027 RepID=K9WKA1_9CYAN|nr:phosphate-starvation-inducible PsiE family protein [Allocoleopsis franciscana]AFZ20598.1 putative membrane protein [Allocoleopsis franciscana PCC 7113]
MQKALTNPPSNGYEWLKRNRIVRILETIQDLFVVSLCIALFALMAIQLREMFFELLPPLDFPGVTSDILFLLILVELFRLLIIYLQEQRVSIGVAVEVSIVSVLREVIVRGVLETSWIQILAACAFLLVMAALLVVRVWLPPTFKGVDPEKRLSIRNNLLATDNSSNAIETATNLNSQPLTSLIANGTNGSGHQD